MKLVLIVSGLIAIQAGVIKEDECKGVKINGVYYEKETLLEDLDRPCILAVDYSTNNLYFSYSVTKNDDESRSARLNLNTKELYIIEDVTNGYSHTVNQESHEIYIGGSNGIYKYDSTNNKAEIIAASGSNIWLLYFKNVLYYTEYPKQVMYTLVDGVSTKFQDLENIKVDNFVIDNEGVIFFTNDTGLYSQNKGTKNANLFKEASGFRFLSTDKNGNVYASLEDGIYAVKKATASLEKVIEVSFSYGLAFDNDNNFVYSEETALIRLKANKHKKC